MRWLLVVLCFFIQLKSGAIAPLLEMDDFLCGCEYCITVDKGEPLDIANHMMRCHGWREGMRETMEAMKESQVPEVEVEKLQKKEVTIDGRKERDADFKDYIWQEDELYGWTFSNFNNTSLNEDQWIYLEFLGWSWSPAFNRRFIYSYNYQWIYIDSYLNNKIIYWYDRRIWMRLKNLKGN